MNLGIAGRVALVLGSTSGLGAASACILAEEGARVAFTGRRLELATTLAETREGCEPFQCDLEEPDAAANLTSRVVARLGQIDILVLNSGGPKPMTAAGLGTAELQDALNVLLLRQIELVKLVLPDMLRRKWGRIIAIGSTSVQSPIPNLALSNIGRSALAAYLKTLAAEVAHEGVTVNMVIPGLIATDRLKSLNSHADVTEGTGIQSNPTARIASIPAGRHGTTEEFAAAVAFLASTRASYVTGAQMRCDGGLVRSF